MTAFVVIDSINVAFCECFAQCHIDADFQGSKNIVGKSAVSTLAETRWLSVSFFFFLIELKYTKQ